MSSMSSSCFDDESSIQQPVYYPTVEEFQDFEKYVTKIKKKSENYGYAKIIPPQGWYGRSYEINNISLEIPNPITQHVIRRSTPGVYDLYLEEKGPWSIQEYYNFATKNSCSFKSDEDAERKFWRSLGNKGTMADPVYGADIPGTLFGDLDSAWNLNNLKNKLKLLKNTLAGVNTSMLYVGSWRAMFAYHTEDMNLYSINYLHTGAPKSWCIIPPHDDRRFESFANSHFGIDFNLCRQYLRHKDKLISPTRVRSEGIDIHTVTQCAGQFIITFPRAYHCGFNHGFNIAESTNFILPNWVPDGYLAHVCRCKPLNVWFSVAHLEALMYREKHKRESSSSDPKDESSVTCRDWDQHDFLTSTSEDGLPLQFCCHCSTAERPWCHKPCTLAVDFSSDTCHLCKGIDIMDGLDVSYSDMLGNIVVLSDNDDPRVGGDEDRGKNVKRGKECARERIASKAMGSPCTRGGNNNTANRNWKEIRLEVLRSPYCFHLPLLLSNKNTEDRVEGRLVEVDMDEGYVRIHVKGEAKDRDQWLATWELPQALAVRLPQPKQSATPRRRKIKSPHVTADGSLECPSTSTSRPPAASAAAPFKASSPSPVSHKKNKRLPTPNKSTRTNLLSDDSLIHSIADHHSSFIRLNRPLIPRTTVLAKPSPAAVSALMRPPPQPDTNLLAMKPKSGRIMGSSASEGEVFQMMDSISGYPPGTVDLVGDAFDSIEFNELDFVSKT